MTDKEFLKVRAPAKLILSGEHSVVYGQPALAMAVDRYTETIVRWTTPLHFSFNLLGIDFRQKVTLEALKRLKQNLNSQYEKFNLGKISIREVLKNPFELTLYTAINVIERLKHKLPMGIDIATESNIPIGCGMGSSAASVVSVIYGLCNFLDIEFSIDDYIRLGIKSENLQHGVSSGLDVQVIHQGGCIHYQQGMFTTRPLPQLSFHLIQTGKPESTTGECVSHAKSFFEKSSLCDDFAAVTSNLDQALQGNKQNNVNGAIQENHRLLKRIGVVTDKAAQFIEKIEKLGGAAKICGAGSIKGDNAGIILAICKQDISSLTEEYGYKLMPVTGDSRGVHIV